MSRKFSFSRIRKRTHSDFLHIFFNINAKGTDLGTIELKECDNQRQDYTLKHDDLNAEFLLFYNHKTTEFALVETSAIHPFKHRTSIMHSHMLRLALWTTTDETIMMNQLNGQCPDYYLKWKAD